MSNNSKPVSKWLLIIIGGLILFFIRLVRANYPQLNFCDKKAIFISAFIWGIPSNIPLLPDCRLLQYFTVGFLSRLDGVEKNHRTFPKQDHRCPHSNFLGTCFLYELVDALEA